MDAQTIIAKRIAQELRDGMLVNLGIGIPTLVSKYVPAGLQVYFQSENGLIGTGAPPPEGMHHPLLTDAGGKPVTALPGAATFDSAMSWLFLLGWAESYGPSCSAPSLSRFSERQRPGLSPRAGTRFRKTSPPIAPAQVRGVALP